MSQSPAAPSAPKPAPLAVRADEQHPKQHHPQPSKPNYWLSLARKDEQREPDKRPLDLRLIVRLLGYMGPYRAKRNFLLLCVTLRAFQLPAIGWAIGAVINGPIDHAAPFSSILAGALGVLILAGSTQIVFHFRQRLALELGEAVIHDLRGKIFAHLQAMPLSFYNTTKIGRITRTSGKWVPPA